MAAPLPLVLLPGLDGTARLFDGLVRALPAWVQPVPVAYPTGEPLAYAALEELALARLPSGPFALLGESFSSPIALRLAARRPEGLVAVVLTAGFVRSLLPGLVRALARPLLFRMRPPDFFLRRMLVGPDADPTLVTAVGDAMVSVRPDVFAARLRDVVDVDATAALEETTAPILYLRGAHDRMVSSAVTDLVTAARPDVELVTLDAPHLLLQRRPSEAAAAIATFLRRAAARTTAAPETAGHAAASR
jgi:pimeloyl-[acyl-carrier protein] methyl ester esterase